MPEILHVTPRARWGQAVAEGQYQGDTLATEGFTHCCLSGQLSGVVSRYFRGQRNLVVVRINTEMLTSPLKWENPPGSDEVFPHLYGPLNLDAVAGVVPLEAFLSKGSGG